MLTHTKDELQEHYLHLIGRTGADPGVLSIERYSEELIVARVEFDETNLRPGGVLSGPTLFSVVDSMGYLVTMSRAPKGSNGFTSALTMQFLRPAPVGPVRVEGRLLKFSKRASVIDTILYRDGLDGPVAQGVVTYVPILPTS